MQLNDHNQVLCGTAESFHRLPHSFSAESNILVKSTNVTSLFLCVWVCSHICLLKSLIFVTKCIYKLWLRWQSTVLGDSDLLIRLSDQDFVQCSQRQETNSHQSPMTVCTILPPIYMYISFGLLEIEERSLVRMRIHWFPPPLINLLQL